MKLRYDLHSHSTASDGTLSPRDLVMRARAQGVDVLALTDHDTTDGLAEAAQAAAESGLQLVSGVEISVTWNQHLVHLVGLRVNPAHGPLQTGLADLRARRDGRAEEIGRRLTRSGIPGAFEGARVYAGGGVVSRTHFARFLIEQGRSRDMREAFDRYLAPGKPGYVSTVWAPLEEAVAWIRGAEGVAVIAHPARYKLTGTRLRQLIGEFKECGGEGIEVVSGSHSRNDCQTMADYAARFDLLASCGSDYHGPETPWMELGRLPDLPPGCTPVWERWAGQDDSFPAQALAF